MSRILQNNRGNLFRPTIIRNEELNSSNYLSENSLNNIKYESFKNTNLESSSSFRYGDKPYIVSTQQFNIDWSKFENHTFFHSAVAKVNEAFDQIVNFYPFDGTEKEIEKFEDDLTGFEKWVLDSFPKNTGYLNFSGSSQTADQGNYITIIDGKGINIPSISSNNSGNSILDPLSSSFSLEMWIRIPEQTNDNQIVFQKRFENYKHMTLAISQSNGSNDAGVIFALNALGRSGHVSGSLRKGEFSHLSVSYDKEILTLLIDDTITTSNRFYIPSLYFENANLTIGTGSYVRYDMTGTSNNIESFIPVETFSGSIDELRYFHEVRDVETIKKEKYLSYYPYTSDDEFNTLKLHLRFNEPLGDYTGKNIVLDSSGNSLHGYIENYKDECRINSGDIPVLSEDIKRNHILFPTYQTVDNLNQQLLTTASLYDEYNPNIITKLVPEHYFQDGTNFKDYTEEIDKLNQYFSAINDGQIGKKESDIPSVQLLMKILFTYSKYFDELKIMIDGITNFNYTEYDEYNTTPDVFLLEKAKLTNTILPKLMNTKNINQLFKGIDITADNSVSAKSIFEIQNLIWRRILSEAPTFKKRKGTIESIKSVFRNAGIEPENILDFREYGGSKLKSVESSKETKKDVIYFLNLTGSIYNESTTFDNQGHPTDEYVPYIKSGYLSGSRTQPGLPLINGNSSDGLYTTGSFSYEGLYYWPKGYQNITESLSRFHVTGTLSPSSTESCIINLLADDSRILLKMSGSDNTQNASELILTGVNIFDKDIWNISFGRIKDYEVEGNIKDEYYLRAAKQYNGEIKEYYQTSSYFDNNIIELLSEINEKNTSGSFIIVGSQSFQDTTSYLNSDNNSNYTDFTGFITNIRFFSKYSTENEWLNRSKNYTSFGVDNPLLNYNFNTLESGSFQRLILHTDAKQFTKNSDEYGRFRLFDFSKNELHFSGENFDISTNVLKPVRVMYEVLSDKFDINYSKDKIRIRSFQEFDNKEKSYFSEFAPLHEIITSEESLDDNRFSLDMSVMRGLNRNIMNMMSDLHVFENALGEPNLIFSEQYPDLDNLRKIFFNNLEDKVDLQKYREIFKWIDNSFSDAVYSIIPRSTNFLGINFIYESHVLERNRFKYLYDDIYLNNNERQIFEIPNIPPAPSSAVFYGDFTPTNQGQRFNLPRETITTVGQNQGRPSSSVTEILGRIRR